MSPNLFKTQICNMKKQFENSSTFSTRFSSNSRILFGGRQIRLRCESKKAKKIKREQRTEDGVSKPAVLPDIYTFHTPGSVQEPTSASGAAGRVIFEHESESEASKWAGVEVEHVGGQQEGHSRGSYKVGVVIGEFHDKLMSRCLEDARLAACQLGSELARVVWVPGTYEAPLVVREMLLDRQLDCVVVIGYIEKGSTLHGEEMGATCSLLLKQLELEFNKPVGMGIIGPGATPEQAEERVAYAGNAVRAAIRLAQYFDRKTVPVA
eukprot:CAMPEP_0196571858 /NCGR_PEP_ID=MMETSP1081-20130531/1987_1 /TAXON_ID=36882 /ORGANISM="Pyramimonas amylifera, Strain CCMP720" /LENGTH=265 /DNA_ID=CAMNT_0041888969 /DNA_START=127 /DNA_END=924 /DNA_ORIENTATION=+